MKAKFIVLKMGHQNPKENVHLFYWYNERNGFKKNIY